MRARTIRGRAVLAELSFAESKNLSTLHLSIQQTHFRSFSLFFSSGIRTRKATQTRVRQHRPLAALEGCHGFESRPKHSPAPQGLFLQQVLLFSIDHYTKIAVPYLYLLPSLGPLWSEMIKKHVMNFLTQLFFPSNLGTMTQNISFLTTVPGLAGQKYPLITGLLKSA